MSIEAMKTALEALDCLIYDKPYAGRFADALIGLRTAIQQPATTEPVAWVSTDSIGERYLCFTKPTNDINAKPLVHPVPCVPADVVRDAERWREVERASCDVTLRLHNTRGGLRSAVIDAAILAAKVGGKQ